MGNRVLDQNERGIEMRFELNTFSRVGDILDDGSKLVERVPIGKGLSESPSVEVWYAAIDEALASRGYACAEHPVCSLPLTKENATERFVIALTTIV